MTAVSENVSFGVLDDIAKNYNNMYHETIKMKPTDFKSNFYAEYSIDSNEKDTNLKVGDHVRILNYEIFFC